MSVTDPVADMLTRVRNACQAGHRRVDMPVSKLKVEIARLLRDNHYIQDFKVLDDGHHGLLRLYLKYHNDAPVIRELQRVSAPGLRRYVKARDPARQEWPRGGDPLAAAGAHDRPRSAHRPRGRRAARAGLVGGRSMSRIGRKPIPVPKGVTTQLDGTRITVKGPKGEISRLIHAELAVAVEGETIVVRRPSDESRHKALHGLTRTLVANMVDGVTKGFAKALEIQGVGYKAEPKPFGVQLVVGFSHPVPYHAPQGIKISVDNNVLVKIEGVDKELVGQVAAEIRAIRPPEPYKGKGIRYVGEQVRRKAGKTAQAAK